jgi:hypothetical protein
VELGGWVVRRLIEEGILDAQQCEFRNAGAAEIEELFKKLHTMLAGRKGYSVPKLASVVHRVLGICAELRNAGGSQPKNSALVRRAEESGFSSAKATQQRAGKV